MIAITLEDLKIACMLIATIAVAFGMVFIGVGGLFGGSDE